MTTKATASKLVETRESPPDELQIAYQVHTLVQLLYARLTAAPGFAPTVPAPFPPIVH
jgi:hypothetical protein